MHIRKVLFFYNASRVNYIMFHLHPSSHVMTVMPIHSSVQDRTPSFHADIYPCSTFYEITPPNSIRQRLTSFAALLQKFIDDHCKESLGGFVWYRESLKITVVDQSQDGEGSAKLCASMKHGGSVEDEWLAVHLLLLASEKFHDETLAPTNTNNQQNRPFCINVYDEDGQFPMIEGADALPDWIQPNNANGRLWMVNGTFHLLTLDHHPGDTESQDANDFLEEGKSLKHTTALKLLQSKTNTVAPPQFTNLLQRNRMPSFPALKWAQDYQHSTLVYLPIIAAKLVSRFPQILANAAEAFEGREGPKDARILRDLNAFIGPQNPQQKAEGLSSFLVKIKVPRRMYATLLAERYFPPKVFGTNWRESVMKYWDILEKEMKQGSRIDANDEMILKEDGRRRDLGCKIVCGLELVHANVKDRMVNNPKHLFDVHEDQIRSSVQYKDFIKSLTGQGYFDNETQDSYQWKQKEKQALQLWRSMMVNESDSQSQHSSDDLYFILDAVKACTRDRSFPPHISLQEGAQAFRLYEDPDDFLYDASGVESKSSTAVDADEDAERIAMKQLNAFSDKLQTFVEGEGDEVGALFEDEGLDGNGDEDEMEEDDPIQPQNNHEFSQKESEKKRKALEKLVPPLPEYEWGAKIDKMHSDPPSQQHQEDGKMDTDESIVSKGVMKQYTTQMRDPSQKRLFGFSSHAQYDGASDSDESVDDEVLRAGDTEEDRMNRAHALDIESAFRQEEERRQMAVEDGDFLDEDDDGWEDESDTETTSKGNDEGFALGQNEMLNFLDFARKELGLSEEQYQDILDQRRSRGEYVPQLSSNATEPNSVSGRKKSKTSVKFESDHVSEPKNEAYNATSDYEALKEAEKKGKTFRQQTQENKAKSLLNERTTDKEKEQARIRAERTVQEIEERAASSKPYGAPANSQADPFQHLMDTMDAELVKLKREKEKQKEKVDEEDFISLRDPQARSKAKNNTVQLEQETISSDDEDEEMMSAQDAELLEKMLHSGPPSSLRALMQKNASDPSSLTNIERQVMDDMLKSYQAQMGQAGPVGNLMGRFGIGQFPHQS